MLSSAPKKLLIYDSISIDIDMSLLPDIEVFIPLICELVNCDCLPFPRFYYSQGLLIYSFKTPAGFTYCFKATILDSEREDFLFFFVLLFYGDY
jgi:hypothetical protein